MLRKLHKAEGGGAAIETLVVLPLQIFITCLIVQLCHFMVARQVVHYAAYAAARAALAADPQLNGDVWSRLESAPKTSDTFWKGTDAGWVDESRVWRAAMNICSLLELYHVDPSATWMKLPTGAEFRYDRYASWNQKFLKVQNIRYEAKDDGDVTVTVSYLVDMPVPIAGKWFYDAALAAGNAQSNRPGRVKISQACTLAKPWRTEVH